MGFSVSVICGKFDSVIDDCVVPFTLSLLTFSCSNITYFSSIFSVYEFCGTLVSSYSSCTDFQTKLVFL